MTTMEDINYGRRLRGQSEITNKASVHFLEDSIQSFERSPKKLGNRDHFCMLLSLHLSRDHSEEIAYEGVPVPTWRGEY